VLLFSFLLERIEPCSSADQFPFISYFTVTLYYFSPSPVVERIPPLSPWCRRHNWPQSSPPGPSVMIDILLLTHHFLSFSKRAFEPPPGHLSPKQPIFLFAFLLRMTATPHSPPHSVPPTPPSFCHAALDQASNRPHLSPDSSPQNYKIVTACVAF